MKAGKLALLAGGLLLAVHLLALVGDGLVDEPGRADLAVVLGNHVRPDGTPSERLELRLQRALELYREGRVRWILASGGVDPAGTDEARAMAAWLVGHGVPADHVAVDSEGVDTWSTARNTRRLLGQAGMRSVVVVTHYYHVPRTRLAMERHGISPVYTAYVAGPEAREPWSLLREIPAWYYYLLRPSSATPR